MNTESATATAPTPFIPSEDELNVQSGSKSWRPAHGKFVRGQEIVKKGIVDGETVEVQTGTYPEEKKAITGLLRRLGIFEHAGGKYGPEHKLECDIETVDGVLHLGVNMLDTNGDFKVGIAALNLAWCLLQYEKDGAIRLETALGEPITLPNGKKGGRPTYINAYRIEGKTATPIYRPRREEGAPKQEMIDQWRELEPQLREHPAYADRPANRDDGEDGAPATHLSALCKDCEAKGWPTPEQAPVEWLAMAGLFFDEPAKKTLRELSDDLWGELRLEVKDRPAEQPPKGLVPVIERLKTAEPATASAAPARRSSALD